MASRFIAAIVSRNSLPSTTRKAGFYQASLAQTILLLKYERLEPLGIWFAERFARVTQMEIEAFQADVVPPLSA